MVGKSEMIVLLNTTPTEQLYNRIRNLENYILRVIWYKTAPEKKILIGNSI
jgi:hypothetical protein